MNAVLATFAVVLLIAAPLVAYARRHRPLAVIGRDVLVPRATCIPTAVRRERPDTWGDLEERF